LSFFIHSNGTLYVSLFLSLSLVVEGDIWRYAKREGATVFFRGIRSWKKDGLDERALQILNTWGPLLLGPLFWPIPTMYLEGNPKYNHVSSTLIRDLCKTAESDAANDDSKKQLAELVPKDVVDIISNFYCKKDA
jgi:phosphopantetheine adenylyltransferase